VHLLTLVAQDKELLELWSSHYPPVSKEGLGCHVNTEEVLADNMMQFVDKSFSLRNISFILQYQLI